MRTLPRGTRASVFSEARVRAEGSSRGCEALPRDGAPRQPREHPGTAWDEADTGSSGLHSEQGRESCSEGTPAPGQQEVAGFSYVAKEARVCLFQCQTWSLPSPVHAGGGPVPSPRPGERVLLTLSTLGRLLPGQWGALICGFGTSCDIKGWAWERGGWSQFWALDTRSCWCEASTHPPGGPSQKPVFWGAQPHTCLTLLSPWRAMGVQT